MFLAQKATKGISRLGSLADLLSRLKFIQPTTEAAVNGRFGEETNQADGECFDYNMGFFSGNPIENVFIHLFIVSQVMFCDTLNIFVPREVEIAYSVQEAVSKLPGLVSELNFYY